MWRLTSIGSPSTFFAIASSTKTPSAPGSAGPFVPSPIEAQPQLHSPHTANRRRLKPERRGGVGRREGERQRPPLVLAQVAHFGQRDEAGSVDRILHSREPNPTWSI
jgi:hypothetical protein